MKNACHFEGTRELAAHEYQVAFELYRSYVAIVIDHIPHKVNSSLPLINVTASAKTFPNGT